MPATSEQTRQMVSSMAPCGRPLSGKAAAAADIIWRPLLTLSGRDDATRFVPSSAAEKTRHSQDDSAAIDLINNLAQRPGPAATK
jgi:hypothetical protein